MRNAAHAAVLCGVGVVISLVVARADTTTVSFDSGSQFVYDQNTAATNKLTGGTSANGNGTVLQLGYYNAATVANNFQGTWVPLSGEMSLNTAVIPGGATVNPSGETYNQTTIGDLNFNGAADGQFALSLNFVLGNATSGNSLPASSNVPLALRFYNGTTTANSTFYNVVSDDQWLWKQPVVPPSTVTISLSDSGLEWLSTYLGQSINTKFHTTISLAAVPEVSTVTCALLCGVALGLHAIRRRRARVG
jgi:hypothetical protein